MYNDCVVSNNLLDNTTLHNRSEGVANRRSDQRDSDNITDVIEHMRKAVQEPEPANDQWLTWIMNLEGGWGMWLAQTVLPIIVIVVLILLCIPCIIQCVSSLVQRLVKVGMSVQLVKMTVYPNDDVDVDDQQDDDASSGSDSERSN